MEPQFPVLCSSKPLKAGLEKFQRIPITTDVFKLGCGQQNTVVMPLCFSKDHCIFKKEEGTWILENCSYSSIKINRNELRQGQKRKLCDQDVIKLESSNEFVYTFTANVINSTLHKKRKADEDLQKDSSNKKKSVSSSHSRDTDKTHVKSIGLLEIVLKEQVMLEKDKKEKLIYDDYAMEIEKLKGSKTALKRQKPVLKLLRDLQLKEIRAKIEDKISSLIALIAKQNDSQPSEENKHSEGKTKEDELTSDSEVPNGARPNNAREEDNKRQKERIELRKLRRETRQLKLDNEKNLKEMEKQIQHREKVFTEELNKVNKKLAIEIEMHEKEKRRVEQLLSQKKVSETSKLDMESELMCSICSELFVHATTLGCSHSFCRYCIRKWTEQRNVCPICRATIRSECSTIVLDSLIHKMAESTEDGKKKRQQLVKTRDELEARRGCNCRYIHDFHATN